MRALITGASGHIGKAIEAHSKLAAEVQMVAASRHKDEKKRRASTLPSCYFDFEDSQSWEEAFKGIDLLFLLRPPQLADVEGVFKPMLVGAQEAGIKKIIFLSVQGAENNSIIPHRKIEKLILQMNFDYIFIRPSYFMQNLTADLLAEIRTKKRISLPAGDAKFVWVDAYNIGEAIVMLMQRFNEYANQPMIITGSEKKNFYQVADLLSQELKQKVVYKSVNPFYFFYLKLKAKQPFTKVIVMFVLHFLPRFSKPPALSGNYKKLTGKTPTLLHEFIKREASSFS